MSSIDQLYLRMNDDLELDQIIEGEISEVANFYKNRTLFITGVTGFLGKCLVEKLLRSCPDLKRIYYLIRKKGKFSVEDRKKRFFSNPVFDNLRLLKPNFEEKVTAVEGDLGTENLGLSEKDRNIIIHETNIMIHNAANVKFDIKISQALRDNVMGTKFMLDLAQECENLEIFMYISTAYSHCYNRHIEEKAYPSPANLDVVYDIMKNDTATNNGLSEQEVEKIIGKFPNVYTYTKAIAEDLVKQYSIKNSKCSYGIYRPSVVLCGYKEPTAGYTDNKNGPVLVFLGVGLGVLHSAFYKDLPIDLIPSDYAINALLVVMSDMRKQRLNEHQPFIYNYGSTMTNRINLQDMYKPLKNAGWADGSKHAVWMNSMYCYHSFWTFWITNVLFHFIPACLLDLYLIITKRESKAVSLFMKSVKHIDKIDYFGNGNWRIHMSNSMQVIENLNSVDKNIFFCDLRELNWCHFSRILWRGLKLYVLKEDVNDRTGPKKFVKLYYLHYTLVYLVIAFFSLFTLKLFNVM